VSSGAGRRIPPHHDPACWGCGANPEGLGLPLPSEEGASAYAARFRFDERHQGGPGLAHGGLVGAALDEACGLLATWHRFPTVTARITVRFRRPVPINADLDLSSRIESSRGRRITVRAELAAAGELLAEAAGSFLHVPLEHFLQTPEGRAAGEEWRRRLASP
jgi:acyl-coenzyme A thioesterase PaaI-like protein